MANHSCTAKLAWKILHRIARSLSRLDGLLLLLLLLLLYLTMISCHLLIVFTQPTQLTALMHSSTRCPVTVVP
jgi:hypothetical protein